MRSIMLALLAVVLTAGIALGNWLPTGSTTEPAAPVSRIVSNSNAGTVIDVAIPGVATEPLENEGVTYEVISIPGEVLAALDVGKPQVPKLSYLLGIPDRAGVSVSVSVLETRTFENVNCSPYQTPLLDGRTNPFVIDRAAYMSDQSYPSYNAQVMNTGVWRDLSVANIQVYPVHYNAARKQLTVASRLRVNVNYSGGSYQPLTIKPWLMTTYGRYVDNFGELPVTLGGADNAGVKYLVIAHDNWYNNPGLESLISWHYKRGIETRLIHKASWSSQEVKDSIAAEYSRHTPAELRWAVLVGEFAEIPMRAMGGVGNGDYWYSDLLPPGTPDNYPEIGLSRLSPSSGTDLQNQVAKILKYSKNPPATNNWLDKHSLIACSELYPGKYSACIRGIYNEPMGYYRYDFDTLMCQFHGNDSIARIINEGRSVVTYRGHGDVDQWYTLANAGGAPWYIANVNALTNGDLTPMVYNIACLCGDISAATCLSEAWMRKYPGGAAGSMAATQASYTYPNHGICSTLVRAMCDTWTITVPGVRDYPSPTFDIGWIQCNVDAYVAKYWPGSPYPDNIYMYNVLGDAAMEVWSGGQPQTATVTYPPTVPVGPYTLPIDVQVGGRPVAKALVCAWKGSEFWVTGYTDPTGHVELPISAVGPGQFYVTVSTGHATAAPHTPILPFEGVCMAQTGTAPYVLYLRSIIDDASPGGNGDGVVNPGETVNLPTWIKNSGGAPAGNVEAILRTADAFIMVNDSAKTFGNIGAGDSAFTGSDGFDFTVASACTNGHRVDFTLKIQDGNDSTWTSHIFITVAAPALGFAGYQVDDPPPGGNGNNRLDPGETANLITSVRNNGRGAAGSVYAFLRSGDARLTVVDSFGGYGNIMPDSTRNNGGDVFRVTADPGIPSGTFIPCTLRLGATGGYTAVRPFMLMVGFRSPGATVLTHDTGYCRLSVTGFGAIGYDMPVAPQVGIGFCYPKTALTGLYYGGMLCGNSAAYMVDHFYGVPANSVQSDWRMTDSLRFQPPTISDEEARAEYSDAGHATPQGLKTVQTSYANAVPGYDDFIVYTFDYWNEGSAAINGLYSGIMCDFDIGTSTTNEVRTDDTRRASYMYQTSTENPTMGIKLLEPTTAANLSAIDHDVYVYPTDTAMNESMKYRFLNGTIHAPQSTRSYDWSAMVSAGPFDLPVGNYERVAYAMVGGTSVADFLVNCDSAQSWYDRHSGIASPEVNPQSAVPVAQFAISPNPFSRVMNITWSAPAQGNLQINAFDAAGRIVAQIANQPVTGRQLHFTWKPDHLASGIYFIKATFDGKETISKALLLR